MTSMIVQGFAVWMLARYATEEKVSEPWRAWLAIQKTKRGVVTKWLVSLLTCTICLGAWISIGWSVVGSGSAPWNFGVDVWKVTIGANAVTLLGEALSKVVDSTLKTKAIERKIAQARLETMSA